MLSRIMRVMELAAVSRCAGGLNNQDDVFAGVVVTEGGLAVPVIAVADGVGGNLGGSEASRAAMRTLLALVRGSSARTREELLAGIDCWQPELDAAVAASTKGSATTFTACLLPEDRPLVIHIGDTRAVWLSLSGQGVPLTEDHNELAAAIRSGLREEDIRSIHYRTLTRALGMRKSSAWDVLDLPLFEEPGWLVIVCDGVYRAPGFGMAELLKLSLGAESAHELAGLMVRDAINHGTEDNASAAVVRIGASEATVAPRCLIDSDRGSPLAEEPDSPDQAVSGRDAVTAHRRPRQIGYLFPPVGNKRHGRRMIASLSFLIVCLILVLLALNVENVTQVSQPILEAQTPPAPPHVEVVANPPPAVVGQPAGGLSSRIDPSSGTTNAGNVTQVTQPIPLAKPQAAPPQMEAATNPPPNTVGRPDGGLASRIDPSSDANGLPVPRDERNGTDGRGVKAVLDVDVLIEPPGKSWSKKGWVDVYDVLVRKLADEHDIRENRDSLREKAEFPTVPSRAGVKLMDRKMENNEWNHPTLHAKDRFRARVSVAEKRVQKVEWFLQE